MRPCSSTATSALCALVLACPLWRAWHGIDVTALGGIRMWVKVLQTLGGEEMVQALVVVDLPEEEEAEQ